MRIQSCHPMGRPEQYLYLRNAPGVCGDTHRDVGHPCQRVPRHLGPHRVRTPWPGTWGGTFEWEAGYIQWTADMHRAVGCR